MNTKYQDVLTLSCGLHPRRDIYRVTKQTVSRHLSTDNPRYHWTCNGEHINNMWVDVGAGLNKCQCMLSVFVYLGLLFPTDGYRRK